MLKYFFIFLVKIYRLLISPILGKKCRFIPSCSEYCIESLKIHGTSKGLKLTFVRIGKCHPFSSNPVYDPVNKNINEE